MFGEEAGGNTRDPMVIRIGGLWTGIMGDSYRMHGFENFLLNTAMNPDVIHTLIDRMTEMYPAFIFFLAD